MLSSTLVGISARGAGVQGRLECCGSRHSEPPGPAEAADGASAYPIAGSGRAGPGAASARLSAASADRCCRAPRAQRPLGGRFARLQCRDLSNYRYAARGDRRGPQATGAQRAARRGTPWASGRLGRPGSRRSGRGHAPMLLYRVLPRSSAPPRLLLRRRAHAPSWLAGTRARELARAAPRNPARSPGEPQSDSPPSAMRDPPCANAAPSASRQHQPSSMRGVAPRHALAARRCRSIPVIYPLNLCAEQHAAIGWAFCV
jgi:hypothetical protein